MPFDDHAFLVKLDSRVDLVLESSRESQVKKVKFAQIVYLVAAIYGFVALVPMYFMELSEKTNLLHPEYFYGFVGVALVWQIAFLLIARDPLKYRPFMFLTCLEKLSFGVPAWILYFQGRLSLQMLIAGNIDLFLMVLFAASIFATRSIDPEGAGLTD